MITRREIVSGVLGMAAVANIGEAQGNHATTIHRQALPAPFEGWEAEFVSVTMEPGPGYAPHRHPGFVLGYVVDGQFRFGIEGEPERVIKAGDAFYEPPGAHHIKSSSASLTRSATILAIIVSEKAKGGYAK